MVMLMSSTSSFPLLPLNPNLSTIFSSAVLPKVVRSTDYQLRIISGRRIRQVVVRNSNRTAEAILSSDSVTDLESAASVVRKFYAGINRRDLDSVEEVIAENCVYEDLVFPQPFVGRKLINAHKPSRHPVEPSQATQFLAISFPFCISPSP
ncbi:hypothetical protein HAX54_047199 [Datura stramonium]|uniref:SnoaL-like domain-containing protein n=1 Tax=Datura stramonium TaxID=4076 RepID=A0ABS8WMR9_DATST|nr:hypothetical protein [Datura stramonium]